MCTLLEKNLSTGIRFKQVILKGRLNIQPVQLIYPAARAARARAARAKQSTSPPTAIYPPIYLLYTWQQENQYMARARRGRAGFRKFP